MEKMYTNSKHRVGEKVEAEEDEDIKIDGALGYEPGARQGERMGIYHVEMWILGTLHRTLVCPVGPQAGLESVKAISYFLSSRAGDRTGEASLPRSQSIPDRQSGMRARGGKDKARP